MESWSRSDIVHAMRRPGEPGAASRAGGDGARRNACRPSDPHDSLAPIDLDLDGGTPTSPCRRTIRGVRDIGRLLPFTDPHHSGRDIHRLPTDRRCARAIKRRHRGARHRSNCPRMDVGYPCCGIDQFANCRRRRQRESDAGRIHATPRHEMGSHAAHDPGVRCVEGSVRRR